MPRKKNSELIKEKYNKTAKDWNKTWTKSQKYNNKIIKFINNKNKNIRFS